MSFQDNNGKQMITISKGSLTKLFQQSINSAQKRNITGEALIFKLASIV